MRFQWRLDAVLNARKLTLERQVFLDAFESLSSDAQREVADLVDRMRAGAE
jgi:hypothetical protein